MFSNMKIGVRLTLGFAIVLALMALMAQMAQMALMTFMAALALTGFQGMSGVDERLNEIVTDNVYKT